MQTYDTAGIEQSTTEADNELLLADPRYRRLHLTLKWLMIICMFFLILQCSVFLPYFIIRFGWSR